MGSSTQSLEERDVFVGTEVVVARHVAISAVGGRARSVRKRVPGARSATIQGVRSLARIGRNPRPQTETGRKQRKISCTPACSCHPHPVTIAV